MDPSQETIALKSKCFNIKGIAVLLYKKMASERVEIISLKLYLCER